MTNRDQLPIDLGPADLNARLEQAINNLSLGIVIFDQKREVVFCNERYIEMYRLSPEQVKPGTPTSELIRHRLKLGLKVSGTADEYVRQRVGRNIICDCRARSHVSALSHAQRRNQGGITADERAFFDHGHVLACAVIIAGDGACADIDARTDLGVAKVSKVVGFGAAAQLGLFRLDKIADMRALANFAAGTQMRVGAKLGA